MSQINFQQGIINYPFSGPLQTFLTKSGNNVNLSTSNGNVDIAFAHKSSNYLLTETSSITSAWINIPTSTDVWLYWDINLLSGVRTFGFTLLQPFVGPVFNLTPQEDQHWFNTTQKTMYIRQGTVWREVVRVFAARNNNNNFFPLGSIPGALYAGSQVGISGGNVFVGRIIYDDNGMPIRRQNGTFFTSTDQFYINGSPANTIRFEANVLTATATVGIPAYYVVKSSNFGEMTLANYNDLNTTFIGMAVQSVNVGDVFTLISQGTVTNPQSIINPTGWNWATPGAPLWVQDNGILVDVDPHTVDVITYPKPKPPVGRVITPDTIFFDQGLGGQGEQGDPASVELASTSVYGVTRLSVPAATSTNPIAVGDNDPRNTNARTPLPHTHPATSIITLPYGGLIGATLNLQLQELNDEKLNLTGGTMAGSLILFGNPSVALEAATKQYVDQRSLDDLTDVNISSPTSSQILSYNGAQWVNSNLSPIVEPLSQVVYGTGTGVDSDPSLTYDPALLTLTIGIEDNENIIKSVDATTPNTAGGDLRIYGGNGLGSGQGTNVTVLGGPGGATGNGGSLSLAAGQGGITSGDGGDVGIFGGTPSAEGKGGNVIISGVPAAGVGNHDGGYITLNAGAGTGSGVDGSIELTTNATSRLKITGDGEWQLNTNPGTAGQVLTSGGAGVAPTWQAGGGGGGSAPNTQVIYGTGPSIASTSDFTFNDLTGAFRVKPVAKPFPIGAIDIKGADSNDPLNLPGANVKITGGTGVNNLPSGGVLWGGNVDIAGGPSLAGSVSGFGGFVTILGGNTAATNGAGGRVTIASGSATALTGSTQGGWTFIYGGNAASPAGEGGRIEILSGNGGGGGGLLRLRSGSGIDYGGDFFIEGGDASNNPGTAGNVKITGGNTLGGVGGNIDIRGGEHSNGIGGEVSITAGYDSLVPANPHASVKIKTGFNSFGATPRLEITGTGEWLLAGSAGTVGDVITSNGPGAAVAWGAGGGGGGSTAISALLAATVANSISNTDYQQTWQWSLASTTHGLLINESSASSGTGTLLRVETSSSSTAIPFEVYAQGFATPIIKATDVGGLNFNTRDGTAGEDVQIITGNGTSSAAGDIIVTTGNSTTNRGGDFSLTTGNGSTSSGTSNGGAVTFITGNSGDGGNGGDFNITTGQGGGTGGDGGDLIVLCGASNVVGGGALITGGYGATQGGSITLTGGDGDGTGGGDITVNGGLATSGNGGRVRIRGGDISGGTDRGNVALGRGTTTTSRNGDFLYVPSSAGAPTGTPETITGLVPMVVDTTTGTGVLYFYVGGTWRSVALT